VWWCGHREKKGEKIRAIEKENKIFNCETTYEDELFHKLLNWIRLPSVFCLSTSSLSMSSLPIKTKAADASEAPIHRIRITLTSRKVEALEKG
jgi:hypothetical protein